MQAPTHDGVIELDGAPHVIDLKTGPRNRAERRAARTMDPYVRHYLRPFKRAFGGDHRRRLEALVRLELTRSAGGVS